MFCRDRDIPIKYNKRPEDQMKAISDEFHSLFMDICKLGLHLHERRMNSDAGWIFMKLTFALVKYPGLGDDRKNGALLNIADCYKEMGDQNEHEWVLTKVVEAHDIPIHHKDPCSSLVASLNETSRRAEIDLLRLWEKYYMVAGETSLAIPPIQRSAQHRNAGVASRLLAGHVSIEHSPPALFNQEGIHIAATRGHEETLKKLLRKGAPVHALDLHKHSALLQLQKVTKGVARS